MNEILLDLAKQRFDQEVSHAGNIDSKSGSLIGYSGVIATFIGFLFSANIISTHIDKNLLMIGIIFSLLSILTAFIILVPLRKTKDVFEIIDFVKDHKNSTDDMQIKEALDAYLDLISSIDKQNSIKAVILYIGNTLLGIGILISFISIFY